MTPSRLGMEVGAPPKCHHKLNPPPRWMTVDLNSMNAVLVAESYRDDVISDPSTGLSQDMDPVSVVSRNAVPLPIPWRCWVDRLTSMRNSSSRYVLVTKESTSTGEEYSAYHGRSAVHSMAWAALTSGVGAGLPNHRMAAAIPDVATTRTTRTASQAFGSIVSMRRRRSAPS